jgi:molecular chaperone DnaK
MSTIIGIDLGTTNSVCAFIERGEPRIIINEEGGRTTPSVVGFAKDGERFVGDIAKRQMHINPDATVYAIKRFMGRPFGECESDRAMVGYPLVKATSGECGVPIGDRTYTPREISAMVLQKLKQAAEDFLGEVVTEAVITVPAYFSDRQRQATRDAGTIAGLDVLRIINEPTAAALAYVHDRGTKSRIAVYDFGGGTFDISIVEVERDVAEVRATRGDNTLGGADIDETVVRWLLRRFEREQGIEVGNDRIVLQRLRDAAERAKMELSTVHSTDIHLPFLMADSSGPRHLQATLDRNTLEEMIGEIVQRTVVECQRALEDADLKPSDIDEVVMVGGSSRIPLVQRKVEAVFARPLNKGFNPDEVVAVGAAVQAGVLEGLLKSVTLLDVTAFSLGIEVAGGRFAPLIEKNSTIPAQKSQLVSTVVDNQRTVKIHVLQGEAGVARENTSLGQFELSGIQPGPSGTPRIRVGFGIDANGMVQVSAKDLRSGLSEAVTIEAPTGMSRQEVERLREEVAIHAEDTQEARDLMRLRRGVETRLVSIEGMLRDNRGALHKSELSGIEQALKRGRMALLKSTDQRNLTDLGSYLERVETHVKSKVPAS